MNGLPYYKRYPRDFIEGTIGMPFELKAAYGLILDLIYMQDGKLPDDEKYISGLLGMSVRKWKTLRTTLIERNKIHAENGIISNFRADKQLESTRKLQDKNAENVAKRWKNNDLPDTNVKQTRVNTDTDTYKERDTNVSPKKTPRQELEHTLTAETADAVLEHRQRIRKPLTPRAASLLAAKFAQCPDPNAAADTMIANGWQGFEPHWLDKRQGAPPKRGFAEVAAEMIRDTENESRSDSPTGNNVEYLPPRVRES